VSTATEEVQSNPVEILTIEDQIESAISKFKESDKRIAAVSEQYLSLTVADDGIKVVSESRKEVKRIRIAIEKRRKALNEDYQAIIKANNTEAKRLKDIITPVEQHLLEQESIHEKEKERIRQEKLEKQRQKTQGRVDRLNAIGCQIDMSAVESLSDEDFDLYCSDAEEVVKAAREKEAAEEAERLRLEEEARLKREAEEKALAERQRQEELERRRRLEIEQKAARAEAERVAAERAELDRQRAELEAAQAKLREAEEEQRRKQEQEQAELREKQRLHEGELQRQADLKAEEDRKKAEAEKAEAERLVQEARMEALRPELERIDSFGEWIEGKVRDRIAEIGDPQWGPSLLVHITSAVDAVYREVESQSSDVSA